jgi:hypothetical protein
MMSSTGSLRMRRVMIINNIPARSRPKYLSSKRYLASSVTHAIPPKGNCKLHRPVGLKKTWTVSSRHKYLFPRKRGGELPTYDIVTKKQEATTEE